ncbi:MAG: PH domain-containing protein [Chloroflexaceae bacterium]|nr:PH domain-containing protein [Chloroflexaceae bacterium]
MGYVESMLLKDEAIIYTGRKHYALLLGQIVTEVILLGLTGVAVWLVSQVLLHFNITEGFLPYTLYGVLAVAGAVLLGSAVIDYLRWYNDCVVLTNRRIMKFEGLFNRHMIESSLNKINDVALNQTFFGRMIGYGDITILTAADTGLQEMRNIADPIGFKRALAEARAYDDNLVANATVAAMEGAVEDAMEHAVNEHRESDERIVMGEAQHDVLQDRAPTPTANQRPSDQLLNTMLARPRANGTTNPPLNLVVVTA